jgi:hypothetical protein
MFRLKGTAKLYAGATLAALAVSSIPATGAQGNSDCPNGREIALINGRIHTMDASNSVVSAVTMRNGKFVSVGHDAGGAAEAGCKQVINLKGRLVIPGLVDNHNHIVLLGLRPGYHTPLETAASFADIRATYSERIQGAPAGAFVTTIGGFNPVQLAEENPRRRSRAARLPLSCRYADEQRSPVSNDRRQRHPGRRRIRQRPDLDAQSLADALLHGDRQEQLGPDHQRRTNVDAR